MFHRKNLNYTVPIEGDITPYSPAESPIPDPSGWFCLGTSHTVRPGVVVTRRLLEQDVVLWRARSGRLTATRPYCPHLGAHLGRGGTVRGEDIVCSFHEFAFGPDGACTGNAYGTRPPKARLSLLPVEEVNGLIMVWYHPEGEPPSWRIPVLPTEGYSPPHYSLTESPGHPQEVLENAIDVGHLGTLHTTVMTGGSAAEAFRENGPGCTTTLRLAARIPFTGRTYTSDYRIEIHGVGYLVADIDLRFGVGLRVWALPVVTGPWRMQVRWAASARVPAPRLLPPPLRDWFAVGASRLLARLTHWFNHTRFIMPEKGGDLPVWSAKTYLHHPRLARGDGPFMRWRRWADQFYPSGAAQVLAARAEPDRAEAAHRTDPAETAHDLPYSPTADLRNSRESHR
ncbi:Rieske 2Fe-2S domain-containing protein [Kitasatospora putterlickiae]|uniref:Rieske-type oxygenase n=1 Tax=Kitasatospora putterlickiae TaxID=221725 RepID=A0ABN1XUJ9_9ACTN